MCEHFSSFDEVVDPQSKMMDDLPKELPDHNGPLNKTVPPLVIKMANNEERQVFLYTVIHKIFEHVNL